MAFPEKGWLLDMAPAGRWVALVGGSKVRLHCEGRNLFMDADVIYRICSPMNQGPRVGMDGD